MSVINADYSVLQVTYNLFSQVPVASEMDTTNVRFCVSFICGAFIILQCCFPADEERLGRIHQ